MHVGRRLRQARFLAGMSQEELGAGIGVSFQAVQKYEHGENRLSASRLYKAARLLDRPVSFFFEELGGEQAAGSSRALPAKRSSSCGISARSRAMKCASTCCR